jgi:hypothetical protein
MGVSVCLFFRLVSVGVRFALCGSSFFAFFSLQFFPAVQVSSPAVRHFFFPRESNFKVAPTYRYHHHHYYYYYYYHVKQYYYYIKYYCCWCCGGGGGSGGGCGGGGQVVVVLYFVGAEQHLKLPFGISLVLGNTVNCLWC